MYREACDCILQFIHLNNPNFDMQKKIDPKLNEYFQILAIY